MFKMILANYEAVPNNKDAKYWQVAFDIEHENGVNHYTPVTIYIKDLKGKEAIKSNVIEAAAMQILPGQLVFLNSITDTLTTHGLDFLSMFKEQLEDIKKQSMEFAPSFGRNK